MNRATDSKADAYPRYPREAADPPPKTLQRPHPVTPLIRGWVALVALVIYLGREFLPGTSDQVGSVRFLPLEVILVGVGIVVVLSAVAGFVSWRFTKFVIDNEEFRIETGAIWRRSKRIAYRRIQSVELQQPLTARIFGLAELSIDVGASGDGAKLRYLSKADCLRLRHYLMRRAEGLHADTGDPEPIAAPAVAATNQISAKVSAARLVGAYLLSPEFFYMILGAAAMITASRVYRFTEYLLPGLLPIAIGIFSTIIKYVISQLNFTMSSTAAALKISRGLTNLTSQSIPLDRVQGVRISQPITWRPFGWFRMQVNVLGIRGEGGDTNDQADNSLLMPVATAAQVREISAAVFPGTDPERVPLERSPALARWLHPIGYRGMRHGHDANLIIAEHGVFIHERNVMPHSKVQSVRIEQGPVQRRMRLATIWVEGTPGPARLVVGQASVTDARDFATEQLNRTRATLNPTWRPNLATNPAALLLSRSSALDPTAPRASALGLPPGPSEPEILRQFGIDNSLPLAAGRRARVFALPDQQHVLRIESPGRPAERQTEWRRLEFLLDGFANLRQTERDFQTPTIDAGSHIAEQDWRVDTRLPGADLATLLTAGANESLRTRWLDSYLETSLGLRTLPVRAEPWSRPIKDGNRTGFETLWDLLEYQLLESQPYWKMLAREVPDLEWHLAQLRTELADHNPAPAVVHGKLSPAKVIISPSTDLVSGVVGWSEETLVADPIMDTAAAIATLTMINYPEASADTRRLTQLAAHRLGPDARWLDCYSRYFAFYYARDSANLPWCIGQLSGRRTK